MRGWLKQTVSIPSNTEFDPLTESFGKHGFQLLRGFPKNGDPHDPIIWRLYDAQGTLMAEFDYSSPPFNQCNSIIKKYKELKMKEKNK